MIVKRLTGLLALFCVISIITLSGCDAGDTDGSKPDSSTAETDDIENEDDNSSSNENDNTGDNTGNNGSTDQQNGDGDSNPDQQIDNTPDTAVPVPGESGTIHISSKTLFSVVLSWYPAADNRTKTEDLEYKVLVSTSDSITNIEQINLNDGTYLVLMDWEKEVNTITVTELQPGTTYYFNLLVRDEAGNVSVYQCISDNTLKDQPPTPGSCNLDKAGIYSLSFNWTPAKDDVTDETEIEYLTLLSESSLLEKVNFQNIFKTAPTYDEVQQYCGEQFSGAVTVTTPWNSQISGTRIDDLCPETDYCFVVLVKDQAGNFSQYTPVHSVTGTDHAPVPGANGVFRAYIKTADSLSIIWDAAEDDTPPEELEYKIIASSMSGLLTLDAVKPDEEGFFVCKDWTRGINSCRISFPQFMEYTVNILVRDRGGNISIYQPIKEILSYPLGDVNNDQLLSATDTKMITRYDAGLGSPLELPLANTNGDFSVNIVDALVLQQYLGAKISSLGDNPVTIVKPLNAQTGTIALVSDNAQVSAGERINYDIYMDCGDQKIGAFKMVITFDPEILEISAGGIQINYSNFSFVLSYPNFRNLEEGTILVNGLAPEGFEVDKSLPIMSISAVSKEPGKAVMSAGNVILIDEKLQTIGDHQNERFECSVTIGE
ncbi:MAG: hypothetical protein JXK07_01350 [Spirochaetes bacterium]|nr:hypothetical protein [Spirochaetota bacterium]MBN2770270.1 hypothetical protein [Spirochaetota bacterium]